MLGIRTTQGDVFDLSDNASIDVTGSNPAFDPDVVARFFSFPFAVPATPNNLRLLAHANRLDAKRVSPDSDTQLWCAGAMLQEGRLRVASVTPERLECVFGNRDRELIDRLNALKIRDLMPVVEMETFTVATYEPPTVFGSGGMITVKLAGDVPGELVDITGLSLFSGPTFDSGVTTWVYDTFETPTIMTLEAHGFLIEENYTGQAPTVAGAAFCALINSILNGQENVKWYLSALYETPAPEMAFPTVRHVNLYGDDERQVSQQKWNPLYDGYVNWWRDGVYKYNAPNVEKGWTTTHVPYVRIKYIFDRIAEALGLAWAGNLYDTSDFFDLCLFSNYTLDNPQQIVVAGEDVWMNDFITTLNLARCVPDWTAADFLKKICDLLGQYVQQRGTTLLLKSKVAQMATPVRLEHVVPSFKITRQEELGVTLAFKTDEKDGNAPLDPYVIGAGGRRVEVEIAPLTDQTIEEDTWSWRMSAYDDLDGRAANGTTPSSATPRVFFDRGEQQDSTGTPYRMSSHLDKDMDDNPIGGLSLAWDGDTGLYESYWKGWADLSDKEEIELRAVMRAGDIRKQLLWDRAVVTFYHPLGETRALVKNIQFDIRIADAEQFLVKIEALKL